MTIEADRAHGLDEHPVIEGSEKVAALAEADKPFVRIPYTYAHG